MAKVTRTKTSKVQEEVVETQTSKDQSTTTDQVEVKETPLEDDNAIEVVEVNIPEEKDNTVEIEYHPEYRVESIVQKRPSSYKVVLVDGRTVVVPKSQFDKQRMIITGPLV